MPDRLGRARRGLHGAALGGRRSEGRGQMTQRHGGGCMTIGTRPAAPSGGASGSRRTSGPPVVSRGLGSGVYACCCSACTVWCCDGGGEAAPRRRRTHSGVCCRLLSCLIELPLDMLTTPCVRLSTALPYRLYCRAVSSSWLWPQGVCGVDATSRRGKPTMGDGDAGSPRIALRHRPTSSRTFTPQSATISSAGCNSSAAEKIDSFKRQPCCASWRSAVEKNSGVCQRRRRN